MALRYHSAPANGGFRGVYSTTVVVETYRMKCPRCGFRAEKVPQLPSKAPFSKRFEEAVDATVEREPGTIPQFRRFQRRIASNE
jgi:hypothetical protein